MFKKEIKKIMEPEEGELRQRGGITCAQQSIFKLRRALPGRARGGAATHSRSAAGRLRFGKAAWRAEEKHHDVANPSHRSL